MQAFQYVSDAQRHFVKTVERVRVRPFTIKKRRVGNSFQVSAYYRVIRILNEEIFYVSRENPAACVCGRAFLCAYLSFVTCGNKNI